MRNAEIKNKNENGNNRRGFTLIELLVTIAIIGILASIQMVYIRNARDKAAFASFKSTMSSVSAAAIICWDGGGDIQTGGEGDNICSDTSASDAVYVRLGGCPDAGDYAVANGDQDDWTVSQTCIAGKCSAACDKSGCVFNDGC